MKFDVIMNIASQKKFPIIHWDNDAPCIVGDDSYKVYSPTGGCTAVHPCDEPGKKLYEVYPGDFIGVCEIVNGTILLNSYRVDDVSGSHVRYTNAII